MLELLIFMINKSDFYVSWFQNLLDLVPLQFETTLNDRALIRIRTTNCKCQDVTKLSSYSDAQTTL